VLAAEHNPATRPSPRRSAPGCGSARSSRQPSPPRGRSRSSITVF